eukprot:15192043-Heterocapsa_arctica.AAC.1
MDFALLSGITCARVQRIDLSMRCRMTLSFTNSKSISTTSLKMVVKRLTVAAHIPGQRHMRHMPQQSMTSAM